MIKSVIVGFTAYNYDNDCLEVSDYLIAGILYKETCDTISILNNRVFYSEKDLILNKKPDIDKDIDCPVNIGDEVYNCEKFKVVKRKISKIHKIEFEESEHEDDGVFYVVTISDENNKNTEDPGNWIELEKGRFFSNEEDAINCIIKNNVKDYTKLSNINKSIKADTNRTEPIPAEEEKSYTKEKKEHKEFIL